MAEAIGLFIGLAGAGFIVYKVIKAIAVFVTEAWGPHDSVDDDDESVT